MEGKLREKVTDDLGVNPTRQNILIYTHNAFAHDGLNTPDSLDPFTILDWARAGKRMRCVEYSILAASLLVTFGTPARAVAGLEVTDEGFNGHVFIEYWDGSNWIMYDPQWGITPEAAGHRLSADGLRRAFEAGKVVQFVQLAEHRADAKVNDYAAWVRPYMDVFDTAGVISVTDHKTLDQHVSEFRMRLPRNAAVAERAKDLGSPNIQEVSVKKFYAPPLVKNGKYIE